MNLKNIKQDKLFLILLIIIILLGVFIRFYKFSEISYTTDDQAHIPAGLMWFYPHTYYPGLNYGNPPLGDMMVGAGCMLSGEDFSGVSQVKPFFYPDRPALLPNLAKEKVDLYCHLPMYIFGLIFFILTILFALTFFGKYSALFLISFFAFYNPSLFLSRWIKPDVVLWCFLIAGLFFLLKLYQENNFKKELIFSLLSFSFFALASATKFTAGIFFLLAIFMLLIKHKSETLSILKNIFKKLNLTILNKLETKEHEKQLFKILIPSIIIFIIVLLIPFKLNPKNLYDTYNIYQQMNKQLGSISFNPINILNFLKWNLITFNIIEVLIFLFAIYLFLRLILQKNKTKLEIFIIYLTIISFLTALLFPVMNSPPRAFPFFWGILGIMALSFSNKHYSIFKLFKIKKKKIFFLVFMIIYITLSTTLAFNNAPYFQLKNPLLCHLYTGCEKNLAGFVYKPTADYLKSILKEEETFNSIDVTFHFYLEPDQAFQEWYFEEAFVKQFNRKPTILEKIKNFHPDNKTIRYLLIFPYKNYKDEFLLDLRNNYTPNKKIILNKQPAMLIYDIQQLKKNV